MGSTTPKEMSKTVAAHDIITREEKDGGQVRIGRLLGERKRDYFWPAYP